VISLDVDGDLLKMVASIAEEALYDDLDSVQYLSEENARIVEDDCRELLSVVTAIYRAVNNQEEVGDV
jgi:hypothetical protein